MGDAEAAARLRAVLGERGIPVSDDELEEMVAAQPAVSAWLAIVEELAGEWPAFAAPLPE